MRREEYEILVFSDSHGDDTLMRHALREHPHADVIHLGDGLADLDGAELRGRRVYTVPGNSEEFLGRLTGVPTAEAYGILEVGPHRIYYAHGHREHVKSGWDMAAYRAYGLGCDVLLFGHTHERTEEYLPEGSELCGETLTRPMQVYNPGTAGSGWECSCGLLTFIGGQMLWSFLSM